MAKKDRFDNDEQFENADLNYYYFPPMFRAPEENDDDFRADNAKKVPAAKAPTPPPAPMAVSPMMANMDMEAPMMGGMGMQAPMMGGMGMQAPMQSDIEPGMEMGLDSGTLPGLGINPATSQQQPTIFDPAFLQGYLRTLIGRRVRIEFLIGTQILQDRSGIIVDVGVSYVTLRDASGSLVVCDIYSVKFVTIFTQ
jgi:hypothetical protein